MKIFGLLMVVVKLTLVESSKSVNLVSAGRDGRSTAIYGQSDCQGIGWHLTYRHIVVKLDQSD